METQAPKIKRQRGTPYFCVKCMKDHAPTTYTDTGATTDKMSAEERAGWDAHYKFREHRGYARGTDQARALERLREWIKPGDTIYTTTDVLNRGGARKVRLFIAQPPNENTNRPYVVDITGTAATAGVGSWDDKRGALTYGGYGYSAAFEAVYRLGGLLFEDAGFLCTGEDGSNGRYCPANDHSNGDRVYAKGKRHSDAGYALKQAGL